MFQYNQGTGDRTLQGEEGKSFKTERDKDFGLNWDMTRYRTYDYQLGRFNQVDPLAEVAPQESLSPYQYSFNNPVRYNDPYGDCPECPWFGEDGARVRYEMRKEGNAIKSWLQHDGMDGNGRELPTWIVSYSSNPDSGGGDGWESKDYTKGPTEIYDDISDVPVGSSGNSVVSYAENLKKGLEGLEIVKDITTYVENTGIVEDVKTFISSLFESKDTNTQNSQETINPDSSKTEFEPPKVEIDSALERKKYIENIFVDVY